MTPVGQYLLYGANYSIYTRIVYGALLHKRVPFCFKELDIFDHDGHANAKKAGNPFSKIPILTHDDFRLYETRAILQYLEACFSKPKLFPMEEKQIAYNEQIISIAENYIYPTLIWKIYVPFSDNKPEEITDKNLDLAEYYLGIIENLIGIHYAINSEPMASDFYLEANLNLFQKTPYGNEIIQKFPKMKLLIKRYAATPIFNRLMCWEKNEL